MNNVNRTILESLFPSGTYSQGAMDGLQLHAVPSNCTILYSCDGAIIERYEHYVVLLADNTLCTLRVCKAMPNSGYDAFAVLHTVIPFSTSAQLIIDGNLLFDKLTHLSANKEVKIYNSNGYFRTFYVPTVI